MNKERTLEIVWAAGIIQGEGCISMRRVGFGNKPSAILSVAQSEPDWSMLDRLQSLWGGNICGLNRPQRNCKPMRSWNLACRKAHKAFEELLLCAQFQGPKRDRAEQICLFLNEVVDYRTRDRF